MYALITCIRGEKEQEPKCVFIIRKVDKLVGVHPEQPRNRTLRLPGGPRPQAARRGPAAPDSVPCDSFCGDGEQERDPSDWGGVDGQGTRDFLERRPFQERRATGVFASVPRRRFAPHTFRGELNTQGGLSRNNSLMPVVQGG